MHDQFEGRAGEVQEEGPSQSELLLKGTLRDSMAPIN
jgi:hypothetical protein